MKQSEWLRKDLENVLYVSTKRMIFIKITEQFNIIATIKLLP